MKALELWLLEYLLNSLWQIAVVFLAALLAARLARKAGPRIEHRIWVAALVAETILPACRFHAVDIWASVRRFMFAGAGGKGGEARIVVSPAQAIQSGLHLPQPVMTMLLITYVAVLLFSRCAWHGGCGRRALSLAPRILLFSTANSRMPCRDRFASRHGLVQAFLYRSRPLL